MGVIASGSRMVRERPGGRQGEQQRRGLEDRRRGLVGNFPQMLQFPIKKVQLGNCSKGTFRETRDPEVLGRTIRSSGSMSKRGKLNVHLETCHRSVRMLHLGRISVSYFLHLLLFLSNFRIIDRWTSLL